MPKCLVAGCENLTVPDKRGRPRKFCSAHYNYRHKGLRGDIPDLKRPKCQVPGCRNLVLLGDDQHLRKFCAKHSHRKGHKPRVLKRPQCIVSGCSNLAALAKNGLFRKVCNTHHSIKYGLKSSDQRRKEDFPACKCVLCGWEGPCDRYRIVWGRDGGKYVKGNVIILCPNCHRLVHLGGISKE